MVCPRALKLVTFSIPSCSVHTRRPFEFQYMRIKYCALGIKIREDGNFWSVILIFFLFLRLSDLVVLLERRLRKLQFEFYTFVYKYSKAIAKTYLLAQMSFQTHMLFFNTSTHVWKDKFE